MHERRNRRDYRGFTLVELIIIVAIIGIIGIIAVPQFTNLLNNVNTEVAVNKLMDDIRFIQNYAITQHCNTWFSVDIGNNSYSFGFYGTAPNINPQQIIDPATNQTSQISLDIYPNTQITGETLNSSIDFDWFGVPSQGANITINNSIIIQIESETGYVYQN